MKTSLVPYLNFAGKTREAMEFYQSVLGGKLDIKTFADFNMGQNPEMADKVMHAVLESEETPLMASDGNPKEENIVGNNIHLNLNGTDTEKLTEIFNKFAEGGNVKMPLDKQFWGDTFGIVTDKYGINWMVNIFSEKADDSIMKA